MHIIHTNNAGAIVFTHPSHDQRLLFIIQPQWLESEVVKDGYVSSLQTSQNVIQNEGRQQTYLSLHECHMSRYMWRTPTCVVCEMQPAFMYTFMYTFNTFASEAILSARIRKIDENSDISHHIEITMTTTLMTETRWWRSMLITTAAKWCRHTIG